jgi:hypothetical protein
VQDCLPIFSKLIKDGAFNERKEWQSPKELIWGREPDRKSQEEYAEREKREERSEGEHKMEKNTLENGWSFWDIWIINTNLYSAVARSSLDDLAFDKGLAARRREKMSEIDGLIESISG